ncbi:hypothetical protein G6M08_31455 [Agrobacterium rhizogenes]|nr:hypothetical protein [Rhizobium rhizogenes]NTH68681.1 hypothetical protein [Rhizobium rhizogenes]NTI39658.1 hypothetical protein [Rhizobium rhizogenes]NTI72224.1 hypothetical protein [Rhizobium rhizogenes]TRB05133.1 hypothetical protein EXN67_25735 [Rhizobium rhizogenes]
MHISSVGLHKEYDDMEHQKKTDKRRSDLHLRLVTIDGVSLPSLQLLPDHQPRPTSTKRSFFEQLLLDFAFGSELFYPIQLYEHLAVSEGEDKERQLGM